MGKLLCMFGIHKLMVNSTRYFVNATVVEVRCKRCGDSKRIWRWKDGK